MAETASPQPILVTGAHRSGTTWVGRMLAADAETAYISEPLNVLHRPGVFRARVPHWYEYIRAENEGEYLPAFRELLDFDYHLLAEIRSIRSRRDFLRMLRDFGVFYQGSLEGRRALLKDPFALFSAPWFAERLNCRVVITVRHPAGFAGSLLRLNWPFDFGNLLSQPALMRDHLEPERSAMQAAPADDILGQAALLWRVLYRVVYNFRERHPGFIVVRHEDVSRDPVNSYRGLYQTLGLGFTPQVEKVILSSSSSENPAESSKKKIHTVRIDSRANIKGWRKHLDEKQLARIRSVTEEVSRHFYSDEDWA